MSDTPRSSRIESARLYLVLSSIALGCGGQAERTMAGEEKDDTSSACAATSSGGSGAGGGASASGGGIDNGVTTGAESATAMGAGAAAATSSGGDDALGVGGAGMMLPVCDGSPFPVCAGYTPDSSPPSASCDAGPVLIPEQGLVFDPTGMIFEFQIYCAEGFDVEAARVSGYLWDQRIWDDFNTSGSIEFDSGVARFEMHATSIDETDLTSVDPCAGWLVTLPSFDGEQYVLSATARERAEHPQSGAREVDEIPLEALCEPVAFAER